MFCYHRGVGCAPATANGWGAFTAAKEIMASAFAARVCNLNTTDRNTKILEDGARFYRRHQDSENDTPRFFCEGPRMYHKSCFDVIRCYFVLYVVGIVFFENNVSFTCRRQNRNVVMCNHGM